MRWEVKLLGEVVCHIDGCKSTSKGSANGHGVDGISSEGKTKYFGDIP